MIIRITDLPLIRAMIKSRDGDSESVGLGNVTDDAQVKIASNLSDVNNRQTALDNITDVTSATDEHVLTKDTATGNAVWKASSGGSGLTVLTHTFTTNGTWNAIVGALPTNLEIGFDFNESDIGELDVLINSSNRKTLSNTLDAGNITLYTSSKSNLDIELKNAYFDFDISSASYDSKSFSVSGEMTTPYGLTFSSDGSKAYVSETSDSVYQYTLSTPWDVSTGTYSSISFSVTSQSTYPSDVRFNLDGSKMYICSLIDGNIYQYTLSTPWNVGTSTYDSKSFSVSGQESAPTGVHFKNDGAKMYVVGESSDSVYQYTLSTPWDVSTATYDSKSFDLSSQETTIEGMYLSPDGVKLYILGIVNDTLFQYTLSTPYDVSTASYDSVSFDLSTQAGNPKSIFFKSDGNKFYTVDSATDLVYQYSSNSTSTLTEPIFIKISY